MEEIQLQVTDDRTGSTGTLHLQEEEEQEEFDFEGDGRKFNSDVVFVC